MPFQNGTCSSSIGRLAGVGYELLAAYDFLGHADVFLKSLEEFLRQSFVAGYILAGAGVLRAWRAKFVQRRYAICR